MTLDEITERRTMQNGWPEAGDFMRFLGKNGYDFELQRAITVFTVGDEYEVEDCKVHSWSHAIKLKGIDGRWNGVMFDFVRD